MLLIPSTTAKMTRQPITVATVASEMKRVALEMLDVDEQPDVPVVICLDEMQVPDAFACVALRALLARRRVRHSSSFLARLSFSG